MAAATHPVGILAKVLLLTERRVQQLSAEGVLPKASRGEYELIPTVQAYIRYLRARADGSENGDAKKRLVNAKARLAEMVAEKQSAQLIPRAHVVAGMEAAFANARARLLAIPTKAAPRLAGEENLAVIRDLLTEMIHEVCGELAATQAVPASTDRPTDGRGGDGGDGGMGAAAISDGERVG